MEHDFIDKYANLESPIHKLDVRVKIAIFIFFIFSVVTTSKFLDYIFYFILIFSILVLSKIPLNFVFKRSLIIVPFVILISIFIPFMKDGNVIFSLFFLKVTENGVLTFFNVLIKAWLSVVSMILLTSTTQFSNLLHGFEALKVPKIVVMLMSFVYRYLFVFEDEIMRMRRAAYSRNIKKGFFHQVEVFGNIVGSLFLKTYERGERIYVSMTSRGFDGKIRTFKEFELKKSDVLFFSLFVFYILVVKVVL